MSKINKTIPQGWSLKKLSEVLDYERPDEYIVKSANYSDKAKTPVLTANKSFVLGYTDEDFGVYENVPAIIFDDFTTDSKYVNFPFKVKSSAIKILKEKGKDVDLRFVYEKMKSINFPTGSHKRFYISQYQNLEVIVPPFSEQQKIADILGAVDEDIKKTDEIIKSTEKLKTGLMQQLFTRGIENRKWKEINLTDCFNLPSKLNGVKQTEYRDAGEFPIFDQGQNYISGYSDREDLVVNNIPAILFGDHTRIVKYIKTPFVLGADGTKVFWAKDNINSDFLYYLVLNQNIPNTGYNRHFKFLKDKIVFIPPDIKEQKEIAEILSVVDEKILVNKKLKEKLTLLKKGLMQDLLSGRKRVITN